MKYLSILLLFIPGLFSCNDNTSSETGGPQQKLFLEVVDSIIVDELEPLVIDDYLEEGDKFLMRGNKSRKPYLVAGNGEILKTFEILNEGPDGLGANGAFGYGFLNEAEWVAQGLFNGYHVYDMSGNKLKILDPIHIAIYAMSMYSYRTLFTGFTKDGARMLIGQEQNLFNPDSIGEEARQTAEYYDRVKTVFAYGVDNGVLELLETYPDEWEPKKSHKMVGQSQPIVAFHRGKQELALLPVFGNQLFVYDYSGEVPELRHVTQLRHRYRPEKIPEQLSGVNGYSSYPGFTDLRYVGENLLVEFKTRIPEDIVNELRASSEQYYDSPAYREAMETFSKPYYLWVVEGNQAGVLDGLPVHGALDFADENGLVYVNDNLAPTIERDYNIFYRLKFK
ncbi:hypothetical protein [Cyclobacterium salsum]|uniref:hypothetical protein n=1 Tax=Cyclobacterium salsum TaxID=2666329 RepID=UPI001391EF7A|nr:hypothetical protein [Cyclobacterium salsum]